jgi:hypothetical protein
VHLRPEAAEGNDADLIVLLLPSAGIPGAPVMKALHSVAYSAAKARRSGRNILAFLEANKKFVQRDSDRGHFGACAESEFKVSEIFFA